VETEGSFTADARLLSEYVNLLSNDQINISLETDDFLKVVCRSSETKVKGIPSDDFPVIPQIERKDPIKVNTQDLKKAISQVIFSVAVSETRPEISGVLMNFNGIEKGKVFMVGTDSYRLTEKNLKFQGPEEEKQVIVPVKTLQELLRILNNLKDQANPVENVEVYISENQILFVLDSIELISRLVEGQYPDYKQIIPKETKTTVIASTSELTKAIKTVALFSKSGIFDISLVFEATQGLVVKATNTQVGESSSVVEVAFTGETNDTTLNFRYLLDGLNNIDTEEVEISLVDNAVPCLLRPKGETDYLYIVMPIKQ
jgi:DNA polymerase-3 subunit beta